MKKRVLCYGDSNTWGYMPGSGERFSEKVRWTGICQSLLGKEYQIIEEGLNGRTTVYDDPLNPYLNGKRGLGYSLISQKPLDLVVLFLGTNDLKFTNAFGAAAGADELVRILLGADTIYKVSQPIFPQGSKVLLVSPPLIAPEIDCLRPDSSLFGRSKESERFSALYRQVAQVRNIHFLDAAQCAKASLEDCVHIDAQSHQRLGAAVTKKINEIFAEQGS